MKTNQQKFRNCLNSCYNEKDFFNIIIAVFSGGKLKR